MRGISLRACLAVAALALLILPPSAGAVLSGVNGKIVFVSGRDGTDATSRLYFKDVIGGQGGGAILGADRLDSRPADPPPDVLAGPHEGRLRGGWR